jgi:UDP-N-acetylglucosamine--N-acetylmuramyl-(pentapeptide) pyrophosphoryl-undecaprenol N-acetylglucosamine transferase
MRIKDIMRNEPIHLVFSGGGTGGHLFPGLAVAERLVNMAPQMRITFCGSGKAFEQKQVAQAGFEYLALPARPMPRGAREAVAFVVENFASYLTASRFIAEEKVAGVVGLGGYASVPMAKAATRRGVPLVLLEQNVIPGKATRWLANRASLICTAFDETADQLRSRAPIRVTGNPVRDGFVTNREQAFLDKGMQDFQTEQTETLPRQLLVLGGSGGARALNENVPKALYKIREQLAGWTIVHQSGESDFETTKTLYAKFDLPATVEPFLSNMPSTLAKTSLAVCRAGGTSLAELSVMGVPAVLLPYPRATDDHQVANAQFFVDGGGCVKLDERDVEGRLDDELGDRLFFLLANEDQRARMAAAMYALGRPNAAEHVADLLWSVISSRARQSELAVA